MRLAGDPQVEDRIARRRKLVHQFLGRRPAVEGALVGLFQNHHATAFDARIVGVHGRCDKVGKRDARDEPAALVHLQPRLLAVFPLGDADLAAQHAGIHAHIRNRLGQREGSAPRLAILTRLRRSGQLLIAAHLLQRAALVNGREREKPSQAGGRCAAVHPRQFKCSEAERQVLRPGNESALLGLHKRSRDSSAVEGGHHLILGCGPLMGVALARSHQPSHRSPRHAARRLHQHLQVKAIGKPPLNLPHRIPREGEHRLRFRNRNCGHGVAPQSSAPIFLDWAYDGM